MRKGILLRVHASNKSAVGATQRPPRLGAVIPIARGSNWTAPKKTPPKQPAAALVALKKTPASVPARPPTDVPEILPTPRTWQQYVAEPANAAQITFTAFRRGQMTLTVDGVTVCLRHLNRFLSVYLRIKDMRALMRGKFRKALRRELKERFGEEALESLLSAMMDSPVVTTLALQIARAALRGHPLRMHGKDGWEYRRGTGPYGQLFFALEHLSSKRMVIHAVQTVGDFKRFAKHGPRERYKRHPRTLRRAAA
jgi:hypothetical protein